MRSLHATRVFFNRALALLAILAGIFVPRSSLGQAVEVRRFALVAGANDGGPLRSPLRYAHADAKSLLKVLRQLGGVMPGDSLLLLEPDRFDLEAALSRLRGMIEEVRSSAVRVELLFYYSGHSDEQSLLLGRDVVTYKELRTALAELPADVQIAILDSCSSGALTRHKGGTMKAPFLLDASMDVRGYAYLTSSAQDEVAQESDRIGGSFFTHFLVAGLRGAADSTGDGKITLNEVYQYAFRETLNRTQSSQKGPQHPSYDFQLAGRGDLVLTDLRGASGLLELPADLGGRVYLRDARGNLVMEVWKPYGGSMRLYLEPGAYELFVDAKTEQRKGSISVGENGTTLVSLRQLDPVKPDIVAWRGKGGKTTLGYRGEEGEELRHRPVSVGIVPGLTTDSAAESLVLNNFSLNFVGWADALRGFEIGYIGNVRKLDMSGVQAAMVFNFTRGDVLGIQASGWFNRAGASLIGLQGAALVNSVGGPSRGMQLAGLANMDRGSMTGAQFASGVNVAGGGQSRGFQLSGLLNLGGGSFEGAQISALASANRGQMRGLQLSAACNATAQTVTGAQISSVNFATELRGFQLGLVNVTKQMRGVQIGLVNIAAESANGPTIGLVNYAGDGILAPSVWTSDLAAINIGLKMGSRAVYSLLGAGYNPFSRSPSFSLFGGIGAHFDFHPAYLEVDYLLASVQKNMRWSFEEPLLTHTVRIVFGLRVFEQMSLFAGPTMGLEQSYSGARASYLPELSHQTFRDARLSETLGFVVGLAIEPRIGALNNF
ncbi:MAG: caspase family protein [Myxococcota bacterium]|jgi:hypothetical protein|nr:caspase family protein [Myxococcota bacterium]